MSLNPSVSSKSPDFSNPFQDIKARALIGRFLLFQLAGGFVSVLLGLVAQASSDMRADDPIWLLIGIYAGWAFFMRWVLSHLKNRNLSVSYLIGSTQLCGRDIRDAVLVAIACLVFSTGAGLIMFGLLALVLPELSEQLLQASSLAQPSSLPIVQNLLTTGLLVVVAPTLEEFLFRGLLLHRWALKWSLVSAMITGSILFGILHINPIGLTIFGVMMALLYLKTCKLAVPTLAHAINNGFVALALWLPQTESPDLSVSSIYAGIVCLCLSVPLLSWLAYSFWNSRTVDLPYKTNSRKGLA
ncbi:MAG: CPBP family intramembrane glutamic endopeptidase [Elainellaceae cyanobacterium]